MTISNLSFKFRITGVNGSDTFPTRQNVKKRIENILYLQIPPADAVKLSYVGSKELSAENNLHIADRSDSLYENSKEVKDIEIFGTGTSLGVLNTNFLITTHFYETDSVVNPLYFKHSLNKLIIPESVVVLDKNYNKADTTRYSLVAHQLYDDDGNPTGVYDEYRLYNSFETGLNKETGEYEVFFVQYVLNNQTYTQILNGEPCYKEATAEDLWFLTGELKPWEDVYLLDPIALSVSLPAVGKYAIRYLGNRRMELLPPAGSSVEDPWFPRIVNNTFQTGYNGAGCKYWIKEFANQSFQPMEPYKLAVRQKCVKVAYSLVALPNKDIQTGDFFHSIDLIVQTKDETILYAITNDSAKNGTAYINLDGGYSYDSDGSQVFWSSEKFLGVDKRAGIIHLDANILDTHTILATYSYKETNYTLTSLAMNPIFGQDSFSYLFSIYTIPSSLPNKNLGIQTASVYWVKVGQNGLILEATQNGTGGNQNINFDTRIKTEAPYDETGRELEGVIGLHYSRRASSVLTEDSLIYFGAELPLASISGFPSSGWIRGKVNGIFRYMKYESISGNSLVLSLEALEVPDELIPPWFEAGTEIELVNFLDHSTTLTTRMPDSEDAGFDVENSYPSVYTRYFVLGELTVNPPHNINDIAIVDVRENGGGLRQELYEEAKAIDPRAQWLNNYNSVEGQKTPGNAVVVIKLPKSILDSYTLENLQEIVEQSVPFGVYPVVRFFSYEPQITSIVPDDDSITITWRKEGIFLIYSIWYALNQNGPWTKANTDIIIDSTGTENTYTIAGLSAEKTYYVKVEAEAAPFSNLINFKFEVL
jgi:hypothetical protein